MRKNKNYDEYNDTMDDEVRNMDKIAKAERLGVGDFLLAAIVAAAVYLLQTFWTFPAIPPSVWDDVTVAAGIRPAFVVTPGLWMNSATFFFKTFGLHGGIVFLQTLGHVALAVITMLMYSFIREVLTFVMRARPQHSRRRKLVMRIASALGALSFAACDPVWGAGQFFSETTLLLVLTVGAIEFFFAFLRKGTLKYSYVCAILLGFLSADTPMGIALVMIFITINFIVLKMFPNMESPFFKPALIEVGKWHMTFFFGLSLIIGIALNCVGYIEHQGLVPTGASIGSLPLKYAMDYLQRATTAAGMSGWIILVGLSFAPFIVSLVRFSPAADEENFLAYSTGMVFLFCGVLAFSQCASLPALWFWTYVPVKSPYLLALCSLMCALTVACSITIIGVDSLCRNHTRLAKKLYGVGEDGGYDDESVMSKSLASKLRAFGIVIVPLLLVAALLPGCIKSATRAMLAFIDDVVNATVTEAGKVGYIVTDGKLDAAIELESRSRGGDLKCINVFGIGGPNLAYLRTRGMENDKELYEAFKFDGAMGLRCWIHDKPDCLTNVAAQVGFDLWRRDGKALPPMGGLLSLPASKDEQARLKGVEKAHELEKRALEIINGGIADCTDKSIRSTFFFALWRLSRMCLYRHDVAGNAGDVKTAMSEMEMHQKLDAVNEDFQKEEMRRMIKSRNTQMQSLATPREILHLALVRADFQLGSVYADLILASEPDDPDANFVMAMHYIVDLRQLAMGEEYLKRCLLRNPDQPTFYNNLAMVQIELGKLDAAEKNVERALELIPDSAAVMETKKRLEAAKSGQPLEDEER